MPEGSAGSAAALAATSAGVEIAFISDNAAIDEHIKVVCKAPKHAPFARIKGRFRKKVTSEDFALILQHTEGTAASKPTAFMWTHANILAGALATVKACQIISEDRNYVCMPMCHTQGLLYSLIPSLATGGTAVLPKTGKFSSESFWSVVADQGVAYTIMVPATASLLLRHGKDWELAGRPVLRFLAASCGAGLLPPSVRTDLEKTFDTNVVEAFGLTETATFVACNSLYNNDDDSTGKTGSFGRPSLAVQVSVRNPLGAELAVGETGTLFISGAAVCPAQIRGGEISSIPNWLELPRQGCIDSSGNIVASVDSEIINQGGNKLYPAEALAALEGLPAVDRVAVFGVEHVLMGQVVGVALLSATSEVITNGDVCTFMSTSQHPLPARWMPSCTVLVQSEDDWPLNKSISELAEAFGLPVLSGRSNETFFFSASAGLARFDSAAAAAVEAASGGASNSSLLNRSVSLLARENQELFELEDAVTKSYVAILGVDAKELGPDSNFFDYGASLHVLALLAELKRLTQISLSQTDIFICPTIKQQAACLLLKKKAAAGISLGPPPVVHLQELEKSSEWKPASYGQEQMCLANEQSGAGAAYNMPYCVKMSGSLNVSALRAAILSTVRAEGGLRTLGRLNYETLQAEQRVISPSEAESCLEFLEHTAQSDVQALEIVQREQAYIFNLEQGPVVRVNLIQVSAKLHYVLINFHHLNIDGWSQALHRHQVLVAYVAHATAAAEMKPPPPDPPAHRVTYLDFSVWQRKWLEGGGAAEKQLEYWKEELAGAGLLGMPFDRRRTAAVSQNGGLVHVHIPSETVNAWRKLLASHGCTLFMGSLAVFHVLLHRWSGQSDIIVGAATANRGAAPELPNMIGQFANELAIRCNLQGRPTYSELLERVRTKVLAAWAAQDVSFHEVVAALDFLRVAGANPIFQAFFALQETSWHTIDVDTTVADNLQADIVRIETKRSKFSVHLMLRERSDGGLDGDLLYPTDLWEHATIERMAKHYETLVASAVDHAWDVPVAALQMLPPEEQHMVQVEWNRTAPSPGFPKLQRIEAQIAAAAAKNPSAIALEDTNGRKMTYGELVHQSSAIAAHLSGLVQPGEPVALAFKGEIEMVVGILSALMAGSIYVPIDVEHTPTARMQAMLEDSKARVFLLMDR
jgi:non-ribosomal peptide synthetase component F